VLYLDLGSELGSAAPQPPMGCSHYCSFGGQYAQIYVTTLNHSWSQHLVVSQKLGWPMHKMITGIIS